MSIFVEPNLPKEAFSLRQAYPGQVAIPHRFTGKIETISRGAGIWTGSVTWVVESESDMRRIAQLQTDLRGQVNQVRIELPEAYRPESSRAPTALTLSCTAVQQQTDGSVRATITQANATWTPEINDFINIGNRLYIIKAKHGGDVYSVDPRFVPTGLPLAVVARSPFIVATATSNDQLDMMQQGWRYDNVNFEFVEHLP